VAHRAVQVGLSIPAVHGIIGSYPPLANEWYDSSYDIKGWEVITFSDFPQVGFVSAKRGEINGHMGIVDFDGNVISAGMDNVNRFLSLKNTIMRKFKEK
jgi:hypothetical protein